MSFSENMTDIFHYRTQDKKVMGIVFYMGDNVLEIDDKNMAIPFGIFF